MKKWIYPLAFVPPVIFPFAALLIGFRNSSIFDAPHLLRASPFAVIVFLLGVFITAALSHRSGTLKNNLPGIALFLLFTAGYFLLASVFNKPGINTNNMYFAADTASWYQRMAAEDGWQVGTRAVHPLAFVLFRPLVMVLSFFTSGDRFFANLILLALAGGGCVVLMWKIVLDLVDDAVHALLLASLFGLSASQLIFSSIIESYIFSTFCLLILVRQIMKKKSIPLMMLSGIATMGITITNLIQPALIHLIVRRNIKQTVLFFSLVLIVTTGLNLLSRSIYPLTGTFLLPANLVEEQRFSQQVTLDRAGLVIENLLIYNIVAPQPFIQHRNEMPRMNFLRSSITEFPWFGWPALVLWITTMAFAIIQFLKNPANALGSPALSTSMLACLAFNFLLHIGYGAEPFLYSANWTYALILFIAGNIRASISTLREKVLLLVLLMTVIINNLWFLYLVTWHAGKFLI